MLNHDITDSDDSSDENGDSMSLATSDKNRTFSSFTQKLPSPEIQSRLPISPTGLTNNNNSVADEEFNQRLEQIIEERANYISEIVANAILGENSSHNTGSTGQPMGEKTIANLLTPVVSHPQMMP